MGVQPLHVEHARNRSGLGAVAEVHIGHLDLGMTTMAGDDQILHGHVLAEATGLIDRCPSVGDALFYGVGVAGVDEVHITSETGCRRGVGVQQCDHRIDFARTLQFTGHAVERVDGTFAQIGVFGDLRRGHRAKRVRERAHETDALAIHRANRIVLDMAQFAGS